MNPDDCSIIAPCRLSQVIKDKCVKEVGTHAELVVKKDGHYAELSKLSGMGGGEGGGDPGDEHALDDVMKMVKEELERQPTNAFLSTLSQKLKSSAAYNKVNRNRLKELQSTYEHALKEYYDHEDDKDSLAKMQADVESAKAKRKWVAAAGVSIAKNRFLSLLHRPAAPDASAGGFANRSKKARAAAQTLEEAKADLLGPAPPVVTMGVIRQSSAP